jgi:DNA-binding transcriptional ArsR family regulator
MSRQSAAKKEESLDAVFSALGDPTRRRILARLSDGPVALSELAAPFAMTLPAVSKHLRVLERARLVRRERDGWYHRFYLVADTLEGATAFLARYRPFWEETLDNLASYVEEPPKGKRARK